MRYCSLSPAVTEILCALEAGSQIVCTDQFSDAPNDIRGLPHLRGHQDVSAEEIRVHEPDLIFTSTVIQEKLAERLRSQDLQVVHQDPRTLEGVYETIRDIGVLLEKEKEAHALVQRMREEMNQVKKRAQQLPRHPRVYIEEWHDPPMVSGNWVPDVLQMAGGKAFPLPRGALSREVSLEDVCTFDPELIIVSYCGAGDRVSSDLCTKRPGWDGIRAVQQGNVFVVDDALLNRPGPRLVEGVKRLYSWIFQVLH